MPPNEPIVSRTFSNCSANSNIEFFTKCYETIIRKFTPVINQIVSGQPNTDTQFLKIFFKINSFLFDLTTQETLYCVTWSTAWGNQVLVSSDQYFKFITIVSFNTLAKVIEL